MIDDARVCGQQLGDREWKDMVALGFARFDQNEKTRGHKAICVEIFKDFPDVVRQ